MVMRTKQLYRSMMGYASSQYCSVKFNFASRNRVAEKVDQPILKAARISPTKPLRRTPIDMKANKITGNRQ